MMDVTLDTGLQALWQEYNQVRVRGDKKRANLLLGNFIDRLQQQEARVIKSFVEEVCNSLLDQEPERLPANGTAVSEKEIRIQHPLFKAIIVPVLAEQYLENNARHIKWIGQLEQFFYADHALTENFLRAINKEGHFETTHFFEKAFAIDNRQDILSLLLDKQAQTISYYLHEVPDVVLAEPQVLNDTINHFKNYWRLSDNRERWHAALESWELIASHWTSYQLYTNKYDDFAHYLAAHS